MRLRRQELDALGKLFSAEVDGRLPVQSKAAVFLDLVDLGLAAPMERTVGTGCFAARISGFQLTHAGRILYCENC